MRVSPKLRRVPTACRLQQGAAAEQLAARYLEAMGLRVLASNARCRAGEIDLVCLDGDVLTMVEVRQRARLEFGGAVASVNLGKQRKIIRAARFLLQRQAAWQCRTVRFDVVGIEGLPQGYHRIVWIKDAFRVT